MERYNLLLIVEKIFFSDINKNVYKTLETPGLRVIQTKEYLNIIGKNPGLLHENLGDFYSKVPVDELAEAVYKALDKDFLGNKLNKNLIIVDASEFNPAVAEIKKYYLIREDHGIGFYLTERQTPGSTIINHQRYCTYGAMAVEYLFSDEQKGSLQVSLGKTGAWANTTIYDMLVDELEGSTSNDDYAINTLKKVIAEEEKKKNQ